MNNTKQHRRLVPWVIVLVALVAGCSNRTPSRPEQSTSRSSQTRESGHADSAPAPALHDSEMPTDFQEDESLECVVDGRVKKIQMLSEYTGTILSCDFLPLFVVVVQPIKLIAGHSLWGQEDMAMAMAIHSPSQSFPSAYAGKPITALEGDVFRFCLIRKTGQELRLLILQRPSVP